MASCNHEWIVWGDESEPVKEFEKGTSEEVVWALIEEDKDRRYAECDKCGTTLNA